MAYNQNIPQATDQLSQSQSQLLGNFQAIKTLIDIDHVTFDALDQGKHNKVSLPVQASAPAFGASENGIYSRQSINGGTGTNINEIYLNKFNNATTNTVAMTASILSTNASPGDDSAGWSLLPSGILLKWGTATITSTSGSPVQTITFPVAVNIPAFLQCFTVQLTPRSAVAGDPNTMLYIVNIAAASFTAICTSRTTSAFTTTTMKYLAIGMPTNNWPF